MGKSVGPVVAFVALGCAHYVPVRPEAREAGGVRGEVVAIKGEFLSVFDVHLTPATPVAVGSFRLASARAKPCSAGDPVTVLMAGRPEGLTLTGDTLLTLNAGAGAVSTRMAAGDAVIDVQVGDAAASCVRIPISGESGDARWVSPRRWGLAMNGSLAWNYALARDSIPLAVGATVQRRLGAVRVGGRADMGGTSQHIAAGIGPAASARARIGERWVVAGELAYEAGGIDRVGFAHGPRPSVALWRARPRVPGFSPEPFAGEGLEIFGGYWFVRDRPSDAAGWYVGAGLSVALGP